jgi:hypothetical protein
LKHIAGLDLLSAQNKSAGADLLVQGSRFKVQDSPTGILSEDSLPFADIGHLTSGSF